MATVLAIVAEGSALPGTTGAGGPLEIEVRDGWTDLAGPGDGPPCDLLVLARPDAAESQEIATRLQRDRRWRNVPVLYVLSPDAPGFMVPGSYRADLDGIIQDRFHSPAVARRIRDLARDGAGSVQSLAAGPFELDPLRGQLRCDGTTIGLTTREADILAQLMLRPGSPVAAQEIVGRAWGAVADVRTLQILRRHVSNIRTKLRDTPGARTLRTVRGGGYVFDPRRAV